MRSADTVIGEPKNLVPKKGLEPPRPCGHMDLNHARLPVPPLRQVSPQLTYRSRLRKELRPDFKRSRAQRSKSERQGVVDLTLRRSALSRARRRLRGRRCCAIAHYGTATLVFAIKLVPPLVQAFTSSRCVPGASDRLVLIA